MISFYILAALLLLIIIVTTLIYIYFSSTSFNTKTPDYEYYHYRAKIVLISQLVIMTIFFIGIISFIFIKTSQTTEEEKSESNISIGNILLIFLLYLLLGLNTAFQFFFSNLVPLVEKPSYNYIKYYTLFYPVVVSLLIPLTIFITYKTSQ